MQLQFDTNPREALPVEPQSIGLSAEDILRAISRFDAIGIWRFDLDTGLVFWADEVFEIHGWEVKDGPVDLAAAIGAYHPDDRDVVSKCIEEASKNKTGFRFVLRIKSQDDEYIWVKSSGLYRKFDDGSEEIFGYIKKFSAITRSVTILS